MDKNSKVRWAWVAVGVMAAGLFICGGLIGITLHFDRRATLYPDSTPISSHSRYRLPNNFRWDDSYSTQDPINEVFEWYSVSFGLGAESKANGSCSLAENTQSLLLVERYYGVMICEVDEERLIYVNRTTYWR